MITFSMITSQDPNIIAKQITRQNGRLIKDSKAYMKRGVANVFRMEDLGQFNSLLDQLSPCNAMAYGVPPQDNAVIVKGSDLPANPGAISRSDKYFSWPSGGGVLFLDYDPAHGATTLQPEALLGTLSNVLGGCGMLWRPSASGFIYDRATGEELDGLKGQHVYIAVADASDIPRAGAVLFKRLWLAGHGGIVLAQNGAMLVRALVDAAVWQPSRLDFAAGAVCGPDLYRNPPKGVLHGGGMLDTHAALPDLTPAEDQRYRDMIEAAKGSSTPASQETRETYIHQRAAEEGVTPDAVRARYEMAEDMGVLCGDFPIEMAGGAVFSVSHILAHPGDFHDKICLDPVEPEYNNRHPVGKLYLDSKGTFLDSKAHGGRVFVLGIDTGEAFKAAAKEGGTYKDTLADIRKEGGELDKVEALAHTIKTGPFSAFQRAALASELKGQLKENKRLTKEITCLIDAGGAVPTQAPVPHAPDFQVQGQALPQNVPIHPSKWAPYHTTGKDEKPLATIDNFRIMASAYGVGVTYNAISKEISIDVPGHKKEGAMHDESAINHVVSIANLNRFPKGDAPGLVCCLAHEHTINPVQALVSQAPWDGVDHIGALWGQVTLAPEEDAVACEVLFRKWFRGAVATGVGRISGFESVLVWVDEEGGAGKTRFFRSLSPDTLRTDGVQLDTADKDSVKEVISHWLVELGELDGTFNRSEIASLKAFLSKTSDKIRLPYARTYSSFPRTTAFMASVNKTNFLADETGNRRFWPIRITAANYAHNVNMQQVWAQAWAEVLSGQSHYLNEAENKACSERNRAFRSISRVEEALAKAIDLDADRTIFMNCTDIATQCGINNAHKGELNEVACWLRDKNVSEVTRRGSRGFMMPPLSLISIVGKEDITSKAFKVVK